MNNQAFKLYPISNQRTRDRLPVSRDPNEPLNLWSIIKENIGKDLTKITLPVFINEPMGLIQRLCCSLNTSFLLDKAAADPNPLHRVAYVLAYKCAEFGESIHAQKKPFNPVLGETFELIDNKRGIKVIGEQVSHHPPISAIQAEGKGWIWYGDNATNVKVSLNEVDVNPINKAHCFFKVHNEFLTIKKPGSTMKKVVFGQRYLVYSGECTVKNLKTGDEGTIFLKSFGLKDKDAYKFEGHLKDSTGKIRYNLKGFWNSWFSMVNAETKEETELFRAESRKPGAEFQYNYNEFLLNINHVSEEHLKTICPTDSRLRPDQRALENGNLQLAASEKHRLEEKQRAKRKERELRHETWKPKWFVKEASPSGEPSVFIYKENGKYFECHKTGNWNECEDLF